MSGSTFKSFMVAPPDLLGTLVCSKTVQGILLKLDGKQFSKCGKSCTDGPASDGLQVVA